MGWLSAVSVFFFIGSARQSNWGAFYRLWRSGGFSRGFFCSAGVDICFVFLRGLIVIFHFYRTPQTAQKTIEVSHLAVNNYIFILRLISVISYPIIIKKYRYEKFTDYKRTFYYVQRQSFHD
jgi:hypothetical protein